MNTRTERHELPNGFIEVGTVTHEGREYSADGAMVTDKTIMVYPDADQGLGWGDVTSWRGRKLGRFEITGRARGFNDVELTCYRITLNDGRVYVGRGLGAGMALRARRAKS